MRRIKLFPSQRNARDYLDDTAVKASMSGMDREKITEYRDQMIMMIILDSSMILGETLAIKEV